MESIVQAVVAILAIVNPIGAAPLFASLTSEMSKAQRRSAALRASLAVLLVLAVAAMSGEVILSAFGITLPAFQAGGGLVVLLMGLEMLRGAPSKVQHVNGTCEEPGDSILVPFVMPLVAGPGAITTVVTLTTARDPGVHDRIKVLIAVVIVAVVLCLFLLGAGLLSKVFSGRAHQVFVRFMGLILVAVGSQMLLAGVTRFIQ